jgi:hypothetical protein
MNVTILFNGKPIAIRPRSGRMVRFILAEQESIEAIACGKLTLSFAGRKIQGELTRSYRPQRDEND